MKRRKLILWIFSSVVLFCSSFLWLVSNRQQNLNRRMIFSQKINNPMFPIWKTIELAYQDVESLREEAESKGFETEFWANDILKTMPVVPKISGLDLVIISAGQLGFKDWVTYQEIFRRAQEVGLKPFPDVAALKLRIQYPNQPENEWLHIGMEPIIASDGDPTVFDILHFDGHAHGSRSLQHSHHSLQLCSSSVRSDVFWSPSSKWVFAKKYRYN